MSKIEALLDEVHAKNLNPLWEFEYEMFTTEPKSPIGPWKWDGDEIISLLTQFAQFPNIGGGDRRAFSLIHPDNKKYKGANWNFQIGFQLIKKGEKAPPHRHSPDAARFIIDGTAATILNGEVFDIEKNDFILTPQWVFHEHIKWDSGTAVWMDMLDIPFVARQGLFFFEQTKWQKPRRADDLLIRIANRKSIIPSTKAGKSRRSPWIYKWKDVRDTLDAMVGAGVSNDYDGFKVTYSDPTRKDAAVTPTFSADVSLLQPGVETKVHRHTSSPIYYVIDGRGSTTIDGKEYDWKKHDVVAVPSWAWHKHMNKGSRPAYLFNVNDEPLLNYLGILKEQPQRKGR